jgi:hypothetical protein
MEFKVDISKEIAVAKEEAIRDLKERIKRSSRHVVDGLLQDAGYWGKPSGIIYDDLKRKVEDYCLSDKFASLVDRIIEEEAEAEARKALRTLLNSKSRKALFTAIPVPGKE